MWVLLKIYENEFLILLICNFFGLIILIVDGQILNILKSNLKILYFDGVH